jgi:hypothetical protein
MAYALYQIDQKDLIPRSHGAFSNEEKAGKWVFKKYATGLSEETASFFLIDLTTAKLKVYCSPCEGGFCWEDNLG